MFSEMQYLTN